MRERLSKLLSITVAVLLATVTIGHVAFAYERDDHDSQLEMVLFDDPNFRRNHGGSTGDEQGQAIRALENALYLCVDQSGGQGSNYLAELRDYGRPFGVWGLPSSIDAINSTGGRKHREYTHQGWKPRYEDATVASRWEERKRILLNTADRVFGFSFLPGWMVGYDRKCDSFCALIYYIHLVGDYEHDENAAQHNGDTNGRMIPFAVANPSEDNPDIFWELEKHLAILFEDQSDSTTYKQLMGDLNALARKARSIADVKGRISDDEYEEMHACVEELFAMLTGQDVGFENEFDYDNRIHRLLQGEEYFREAFPSA